MTDSTVYLITGATTGIGQAIAHELAKTGGTVIMVARDDGRSAVVQNEISSAARNANVDLQLCDIGNLSSVRNLATILTHRYEKIDVLINSASVYKKERTVTVDGYETMFATNHLGPFLLTYLLLNRLKESGSGRILNITAPATNEIVWDDLQGASRFSSLNAFRATKMANLLFTFELARRLAGTVRVNGVHPGPVQSQLMREAFFPIRLLSSLFAVPASRAAQDIVHIIASPEFAEVHGKFLHKGKPLEPAMYALDPENQRRLWEISEELTDARDIVERGAEYDPTGSVGMFHEEDIPEEIVRPEDNRTKPGQ